MRIAALYDVHGNLPALEAVLAEVRDEGIDRIVVGGDVLPGPMAEGCFAALDDAGVPWQALVGNGENDVLAAHRGESLARVPEAFHDVIRWVAASLPPGRLAGLAAWPGTVELEVSGVGRVLFCHATPGDDNAIFTSVTPERRVRELIDGAGAPLVVCGHTHMQFDRTIGDVRVVNAGSVGMPFGETRACWATIGPEGVTLRRTAYDLDAAAARMRATGYPLGFDLHAPPSAQAMLEVFEARVTPVDRTS